MEDCSRFRPIFKSGGVPACFSGNGLWAVEKLNLASNSEKRTGTETDRYVFLNLVLMPLPLAPASVPVRLRVDGIN
jgi:hypothetical protein